MLNHQIRGLLFHHKKSCYFAIGFYFFGKSIKKHPDSLCKNDNNNEENVCAYYIRVSNGMVAQKIKNRKLRIKKIGKIGNFALKNRRKIGKSKVLLLTKIASLHPIRVIIKATSPQILCSQDLDQLWRLRSENDEYRLVYWLSYAVLNQNDMIDYRSSVVL